MENVSRDGFFCERSLQFHHLNYSVTFWYGSGSAPLTTDPDLAR
jgi:hypothetical protein